MYGRIAVLVLLGCACGQQTPVDSGSDPVGTADPEVDTEASGPEIYDTGLNEWGLAGSATVSPESGVYQGETEIYDVLRGDSALGASGEQLCQFVYPSAGQAFGLTQTGVNSNNEPVTLACEGCAFAFELEHEAPTVAGEGPYCDVFYPDVNWSEAFPIPGYRVAFHPSWDDPNTAEVESTPALLDFYDGSGSETTYDASGNEIEIPAQWYRTGSASVSEDGTTFEWRHVLATYTIFEMAYYE